MYRGFRRAIKQNEVSTTLGTAPLNISTTIAAAASPTISTTTNITETIITTTDATTTTILITTPAPILNCTTTDDPAQELYCNLTGGAQPTPGNISSIMNKTLDSLNITTLSGDDLSTAIGVFEISSKVTGMKTEDFHGMANFLDKLIEAPASAYMDANNGDQRAGNTLLTSINRMMINSPHNSC
ncbi:hypothetical protein FO519_009104 [Halicephalobus sp. NKZ332]|nr:hypothetical protein FO519_009104 [Halicephalobus sp. NKZ332]